MPTVYLIACSASKRAAPRPACYLYCGPLFRSSRRLVEALGAPWAVLSAKHGLVAHDQVVEPYDQRVPKRLEERRAWARTVADQLVARYAKGTHFVILAGADYRVPFEAFTRELDALFTWETPMRGMGIGCQKQWLARAFAAEAA